MDAKVLPVSLDTPAYRRGRWSLPAVTVSLALPGVAGTRVTGQLLTAPQITATNPIGGAPVVMPAAFGGAQIANGRLSVTLPSKSVVMLDIR